MNNIIKQTFVIIGLCFFMGMFLVGYNLHKRKKRGIDSNPAYEQMTNVVMRQYKEDGSLKNLLHATQWTNFQAEHHSVLELPDMVIYKDDGRQWNIKSLKAKIISQGANNGIDEIVLTDKVHINKPELGDSQQTDIYTDHLHYYPDKGDVSGTKKVELKQPGLIIQGTGIKGNLDTQNVKILNDVTTRYSQN